MTAAALRYSQPRYVPDGYQLYGTTVGVAAGGFWGNEDQVAFTYMRDGDVAYPLIVFVSSIESGTQLFGTENRTGVPVDLTSADIDSATYHDGMSLVRSILKQAGLERRA